MIKDRGQRHRLLVQNMGEAHFCKLLGLGRILAVSHSTSLILIMTVNQGFLIGRAESITAD